MPLYTLFYALITQIFFVTPLYLPTRTRTSLMCHPETRHGGGGVGFHRAETACISAVLYSLWSPLCVGNSTKMNELVVQLLQFKYLQSGAGAAPPAWLDLHHHSFAPTRDFTAIFPAQLVVRPNRPKIPPSSKKLHNRKIVN